jgi:hypothetical protein
MLGGRDRDQSREVKPKVNENEKQTEQKSDITH